MSDAVSVSAEIEDVATCPLCGTRGSVRYSALEDRCFGVPGARGMLECPRCGLLWLTPRFTRQGIRLAYQEYYTHGPLVPRRLLGRWRARLRTAVLAAAFGSRNSKQPAMQSLLGAVLSSVPAIAQRVEPVILDLRGSGPRKLLDVGSGDGAFLAVMKSAGWEVMGIEPDPIAARRAREEMHVAVVDGLIEDVDPGADAFDVVVSRHVLEHVHDPVSFLRACLRAVKPGGRLIILTPNAGSLGHRLFAADWIHLDPPRHLYVFSRKSLGKCAAVAGVAGARIRTLARWARPTWQEGRRLRDHRRLPVARAPLRLALEGVCFAVAETALATTFDLGEELMLTATKALTADQPERGRAEPA